MSGIYIPGMEVPKDGMLEFAITDTGAVILTSRSVRVDGSEYFEPLVTPQELYRAIPVPEHGRLIDESKISLAEYEQAAHDALHNGKGSILYDSGVLAGARAITRLVRRAPTIIPASGGDAE